MRKVVAIVGRTNVGKSTLFNRLIKKRFAITSYEPETTRDRLYAEVEWRGEKFILIDTAGLNMETLENTPEYIKKLIYNVRTQVHEAINEADLILFAVDVEQGIHSTDQEIADMLRKSNKPVLLVVNKVDNIQREKELVNFSRLGMGDAVGVSAISGRKSGDLLDEVFSKLLNIKPKEEIKMSDVDISVVGRPNVGKSTLVNSLIGSDRVLVSEFPGTTIDTVDVMLNYKDKNLKLIDTAGIRRRGKIKVGIEKFSVLRALKSIDRSDVCLLLFDAEEGITKQDLHIAQFILEAGKGLVIVVNKWDKMDKIKTIDNFLSTIRKRINFLPWAPVIFISALKKKNIEKLPDLILSVNENRKRKISGRKINNLISESIMENPPKVRGKENPKVYFSSQIKIDPPTFLIKVNNPSLFHFSYLRYLEKKIRGVDDFTGTPIKIKLKSSRDKND